MELEEMRSTWTKVKLPRYSIEELENIYGLRNMSTLTLFRASLRADLFIALFFSIGFILTLQWLDFKTSNFWSLIMGFIALQHIVIFTLQSYFIGQAAQLNDNILESVKGSIGKLKILQWQYRIIPSGLTITLILTYHVLFGIPFGVAGLIAAVLGITALVLVISEFLSSKMVRSRIIQLEVIKKEFAQALEL